VLLVRGVSGDNARNVVCVPPATPAIAEVTTCPARTLWPDPRVGLFALAHERKGEAAVSRVCNALHTAMLVTAQKDSQRLLSLQLEGVGNRKRLMLPAHA
jgi:hypothetical protein